MLYVFPVFASLGYPIKDLGNCRDVQECSFYCEIPAHTPACWSYGKYVLNEHILGDDTSKLEQEEKAAEITYPVAELGNCKNAETCFIYCSQPQNQTACYTFAQKKGLIKEDRSQNEPPQEVISAAKKELGCESKDTCAIFCAKPENFDKCRNFAQKYGLQKEPPTSQTPPSEEVVTAAKTELGCDSESSCINFCNKPENVNRCMDFAKRHQLAKEEDVKHNPEAIEEKKKMVEEAKKELGCDSMESCASYCSKPENTKKCMKLTEKHNLNPSPSSPPPNIQDNKPTLPCANEAECRAYCEKHPNECPGFPKITPKPILTPASTTPVSGRLPVSQAPQPTSPTPNPSSHKPSQSPQQMQRLPLPSFKPMENKSSDFQQKPSDFKPTQPAENEK